MLFSNESQPSRWWWVFLECDYTVLQFVLANENTSFLLELRELCQVSCTLLWLNTAIYFTIWPIQMIDKRCISAELSTKKQWNNLDWNASIQWESSKKCWRVTFKTRVTFFMYNKMYITASPERTSQQLYEQKLEEMMVEACCGCRHK